LSLTNVALFNRATNLIISFAERRVNGKMGGEGNASVLGGCPAKAREGEREEKRRVTPRDAGQGRREEEEKDSVVACRGIGILPMIPPRVPRQRRGMPHDKGLFLSR